MAEAIEERHDTEVEKTPLSQSIGEMAVSHRLMVMGAGALIIGGFIALLLWINQADYQVLFSGLAERDASQVVNKLKELKVPYELDAGGSVIRVPADTVHETRLALAGSGLPRGGAVGFEVFNEVQMGATEFVQKINYQRALQGELARTIASFSEVDEARVHIVMPRDSLFVEEEKRPSAAVVVRLATGRSLAKSKIQGIVHLVASAVPDLTDADVTLVDSSGKLLFKRDADTAEFPGALTERQLGYQRSVEGSIQAKARSMLEQVLGPGRAVVQVSADIDFTRSNTVEDLYDPDQVAVRSETRANESSKNTGPGPVGSPDQRFSLAQRNASPQMGLKDRVSQSDRENETTNFEISRTHREQMMAIGGLKRLSVAVVVDGPYQEKTSEEGEVTRTFTPRSGEEMRQLTELVRRAVGFDEPRGDEVTVANVPFALPTALGDVGALGWQDYVSDYGRPALNLILGIIFILLVVRPLMKHIMQRTGAGEPVPAVAGPATRVGPGAELPPGEELEEPPELLEALASAKKMTTRDIIMQLAQQAPERTTAVLRSWINEDRI